MFKKGAKQLDPLNTAPQFGAQKKVDALQKSIRYSKFQQKGIKMSDSIEIKIQSRKTKNVSKRNVTDGKVSILVQEQDKIPEDQYTELRDQNLEFLDSDPQVSLTYLENIKNGQFVKVYNMQIDSIKDKQISQKIEISPFQIEDDLQNIAMDTNDFLQRFFLYLQGLLTGFSLMHCFLLYFNNDNNAFKLYAEISIRFNQIFHIIIQLSQIGAGFMWIMSRKQLINNQKLIANIQQDKIISDMRSFTILIIYTIAYILNIHNHNFCQQISFHLSDSSYVFDSNNQGLQYFKQINIVIAACALLAWIIIISFKKMEKYYNVLEDINNNDDDEEEDSFDIDNF